MADKQITFIGMFAASAGMLQVDLVLGAICGAAFFMLMPAIFEHWFKQSVLGVLSLIGGYLAGQAAGDHGGWVSFVASALLVSILLAIVKLINSNAVLEVITKILEIVRTIRK